MEEQLKLLMRIGESRGSLSILTISLFSLALITSIGIMDIATVYGEKRELTRIGENVISQSATELETDRYYTTINAPNMRIPLDCSSAMNVARNLIVHENLHNAPVEILSMECANDALTVSIRSWQSLPVRFPLINSIAGGQVAITAKIGGTSIFGSPGSGN
jgi:hypothetical protein